MEEIFAIIHEMKAKFGWDKTDTVEYLLHSLNEEINELNRETFHTQAFTDELADVLMVSLALCELLDLDPKTIIQNKAEEVMKRDY